MRSLQFLQLARRARNIELGETPVRSALQRRRVFLLLLAKDAAENTKRRFTYFSESSQVPILELHITKAEFGALFSRTSLGIAALTDRGMAAAFLEKYDPESPILSRLRSREEKKSPRERRV